jgi:hypothetical protein
MITTTNSDYFASRAVAEHLLSQTATDPHAIAAHTEMAARYVELAAEFLDRENADAVAFDPHSKAHPSVQ